MAETTITLRSTKGSPLTNTEMDNNLSLIYGYTKGVLTKTLAAGTTTVTLTDAEVDNGIIIFNSSATLTANVTVNIPGTISKNWIIFNNITAASNIQIIIRYVASGAVSAKVYTGKTTSVFGDGTGIRNIGGTGTLTISSGLSGTSYDGTSDVTIAIDSTVALRADTHYIGTTAVTLNRSSANLALTGISSVTLPGSTSGTVQLVPTAAVGTGTVLTIPATTGTIVTTGDTGSVTSTMILDGTIVNGDISASAAIAISKLAASTISGVSLGNNLGTLTISSPLSGTSYNGSAGVTIALSGNYGDTQNPYGSKTANYILAAPNGAAGVPSFRAIVAADIPTLNQNTTGSAGSVAWTGVSGRPTAVSAFTNDSGYITSSGRAYPRRSDGGDLNFYWSGQSGQPTWLWGGTDGVNMYVYNPSNFSVSYATSAGNTSSISSAVGSGYTWTGTQNFQSGNNTSLVGQAGTLVAYGNSGGTNAATMSFHRPGSYAINMGLDTDNVFRIGGWSAPANVLQLDMSGNLTMLANVTAYSDERLKTDLQQIPNALDKVNQLTGYTYTRIDTKEKQTGLLAQDLKKVLPEAVIEHDDEMKTLSVAYGNTVGLLVEAIKELNSQNKELLKRIEILESK